mmetsp:Transcript_75781/g.202913  ORF Transcript_75781/g.202913 Transcript_75781/m.202913 type:complete len:345 (+) Transcript_75781:1497-2531(+)
MSPELVEEDQTSCERFIRSCFEDDPGHPHSFEYDILDKEIRFSHVDHGTALEHAFHDLPSTRPGRFHPGSRHASLAHNVSDSRSPQAEEWRTMAASTCSSWDRLPLAGGGHGRPTERRTDSELPASHGEAGSLKVDSVAAPYRSVDGPGPLRASSSSDTVEHARDLLEPAGAVHSLDFDLGAGGGVAAACRPARSPPPPFTAPTATAGQSTWGREGFLMHGPYGEGGGGRPWAENQAFCPAAAGAATWAAEHSAWPNPSVPAPGYVPVLFFTARSGPAYPDPPAPYPAPLPVQPPALPIFPDWQQLPRAFCPSDSHWQLRHWEQPLTREVGPGVQHPGAPSGCH